MLLVHDFIWSLGVSGDIWHPELLDSPCELFHKTLSALGRFTKDSEERENYDLLVEE